MKKSATLRDVATLSGVSSGTVSKYLNGGKVKKVNRINIENAIQVLDYSPSSVARSFARGKTNVIMLFIITESPIVPSTWVHEQPIIQALCDAIADTDYSLQIRIASKDQNQSNKDDIENCIKRKAVDGMVLLSSWDIDPSIMTALDYYSFPFVIIGSGGGTTRKETVDFDNSTPIYSLVSHLYALGHERFALIGGFREQVHMMKREKGFRRALKDAGVLVDERMILFGDYSLASGFELASSILVLDNPPTAIVCGNDNIAVGAIKAARKLGLAVPDNVSISGFDDSLVSEAIDPKITTVHAPSYEMGKVAIAELFRKLKDIHYVIPNTVLDSTLLLKESTAEAPSKKLRGMKQ